MARTNLTGATVIKTVKGPSPGTVIAGDLHVTWQAADNANGNQYVPSKGDTLHIRNSHATNAGTFTLTSFPDERKRLGDITTYSLAALEEAEFTYGDLIGWVQADGNIYLNSAGTGTIQYRVSRDA